MAKLRKKIGINFIDFFVFVLILISVFVYFDNLRNKYNKAKSTYIVAFNDADGLVKGSPVLLSGSNVGVVKNIFINGDVVYIKFDVFKEYLEKLPECTVASVKTYGLAGSRSLNMYSCNEEERKNQNNSQIISTEVMRTVKIYDAQNTIAKQMVNANNSFSAMMTNEQLIDLRDYLQDTNITKEIIQKSNEFINEEDKLLDRILNSSFKEYIKRLKSENGKTIYKK